MGKKNRNRKKNRNKNRHKENFIREVETFGSSEAPMTTNSNTGVQKSDHIDDDIKSVNTANINDFVYDAERMDKPNAKKTVFTVVVVVLLALLLSILILFATGLLKSEKVEFLQFLGNDSWMDKKTEKSDINVEEFIAKLNEQSDSSEQIAAPSEYMKVRLPMLLGSSYSEEIEGKVVGCDRIWWVERYVKNSPAPLNATLRELFAFDRDLDFYIGNYAAKQSNLYFDYAEIENGVAKIYLNGETDPTIGECDENRLKNQLTEAALQFNTVRGVEIYLNGEMI